MEEAIAESLLNPGIAINLLIITLPIANDLNHIMRNKEFEKQLEEDMFFNKNFIDKCKEDNNQITLALHKLKKNNSRSIKEKI